MKSSILLSLAVIATQACADADGPAVAASTTVRDSAHITLVELPADLSTVDAPRLRRELRYRIGTEASDLDLFRVSGARFMDDGRLVVANGGLLNLALVNRRGRVDTVFGGEGQGPGEFEILSSVHVAEDGTVVAFDDFQGRLTNFNSAGDVLDTRRRIEPNLIRDLVPLMVSMSGPLVGVYGDNRGLGGRGPVARDTTPLMRYPAEGTRPDTLSVWPAKIWTFREDSGLRVELAFGPDLLFFGQPDRFALANTHEAHVSVLNEDGEPTMEVRWGETAAPVTEADRERYREKTADWLSPNTPDVIRAGYLEVPFHDTQPVLNGIALDRDNGLWIAPSSLNTRNRQTWLVVDRNGSLRGKVWLPIDSQVLDVRNGWLAALDQDEYDREVISVYGLTKAGPD